MKYIDMQNINKTNALLSRLTAADPKMNIELEIYSCKQTKQQKKHHAIPKPWRFYISALESEFDDYDFSLQPQNSFLSTTFEDIHKELSYLMFTVFKNNEDVLETMAFVEKIINQCIFIKKSVCVRIENLLVNESEHTKVFLIYNKVLRRVVLIKILLGN